MKTNILMFSKLIKALEEFKNKFDDMPIVILNNSDENMFTPITNIVPINVSLSDKSQSNHSETYCCILNDFYLTDVEDMINIKED